MSAPARPEYRHRDDLDPSETISLPLVGYTDRLGAAPGETIRFMVSSDHPRYRTQLVRLIHGDTNPGGPGFKQVVVPSAIDGDRDGAHQDIRSGSFVEVPVGQLEQTEGFTFTAFVKPTLPGVGEQVLFSRGDPFHAGGLAVGLDEDGALELVVGGRRSGESADAPHRFTTSRPMRRWEWYFVAVAIGPSGATLWQQAVRRWPDDPSNATETFSLDVLPAPHEGPFVIAAALGADGHAHHHFDGRIDRPRAIGRPLSGAEVLRVESEPDDLGPFESDLVGAWDFAADIASDRVTDRSPAARHGRAVNMPTRGVTGYNHSGGETNFRLAPAEYGAIHFHRDDLEDAGWPVAFEFTVPGDLPSGIYAAWLTAGDDEDYLSFTVTPPRGTARQKVAVLMSTVTYVVYENFTDVGVSAWRDPAWASDPIGSPLADNTIFREIYGYIEQNALFGLYDTHVDGHGVAYGSTLRPILNMRPKFRYRTMNCPSRFPADLYLVDWLDHKGIDVDFLTDHDLHNVGADLLRPYQVLLSSSHHEYWTTAMLDGLETYLDGGGRFMYIGGNSLFGVTSIDPLKPHRVEVRRWGAPWPFEQPPGDRFHSTTGEQGGIWKNRGRSPNTIVGIGTAGAGFDRGSPYQRTADSYDSRVSWIFDGITGDLIGDSPNLQVKWGAAGYEFDRVDYELGSPGTTVILGSSVRFNESHKTMIDEELYFIPGRDGAHPTDPQVPGRAHPFVRSDMAYLEYPNGGAVFSAGAICWRGALSGYNYENTVSQVTENVVRKFADETWRR
jgi:N,N-dimethylformamidase